MTFHEFYSQVYLPRHADRTCQLLHFFGLLASIAFVTVVLWLDVWWLLVLSPMPASFLARMGHLLVHNRPTFFEHPVWSFFAYWKMIGALVVGSA
jgi:hypothetical protein